MHLPIIRRHLKHSQALPGFAWQVMMPVVYALFN